jgi:hypothetical protein
MAMSFDYVVAQTTKEQNLRMGFCSLVQQVFSSASA